MRGHDMKQTSNTLPRELRTSRRLSTIGWLGLLLGSLLSFGGTASAQQNSGGLPFPVTTPAPGWIEPGLRLTFYHLTGHTPHGDWEYKLDKNGGWVDSTGARYGREKVIGGGSNGLIQANVIGMDDKRVAMQLLYFLFDGMDFSESTQKVEVGYVAPVGCAGDLWLHPEVLEHLLKTGVGGLTIHPVSKTLDNVTYNGVLIHAASNSGKSVWIYDRASGVLLYSSQLSKQPATRSATGARTSKGGASATFTIFKGSRYPEIPWKKAPTPSWLAGIQQVDYRGSFAVRQMGVPTTASPFPVNATVKDRGKDWLLLGDKVTGASQLGGAFIPPQGLAALRSGQEIDSDPFTRVVTRVSRKDGQSVTITQSSPRQQFDCTYRLSDGLLVKGTFVESFKYPPGMANVIELELQSAR
jgi:hypothetical protein